MKQIKILLFLLVNVLCHIMPTLNPVLLISRKKSETLKNQINAVT